MSFDDANGEIVVYVGDNGQPQINVNFQGDTVWLPHQIWCGDQIPHLGNRTPGRKLKKGK